MKSFYKLCGPSLNRSLKLKDHSMLESPEPAEHLLAYVSIRRWSSVQPAGDMHLRDGTAGGRP